MTSPQPAAEALAQTLTLGLEGLDFHHLGVACQSVADEAQTWATFGYRPEGDPFVDEAQGIRGRFMTGGGPRIELLEAIEGSDVLTPWLKRRVKIYHAGYVVPSLALGIDALTARGASIAREPLMSVYFRAPIAFLMMPNLALFELIEARA